MTTPQEPSTGQLRAWADVIEGEGMGLDLVAFLRAEAARRDLPKGEGAELREALVEVRGLLDLMKFGRTHAALERVLKAAERSMEKS